MVLMTCACARGRDTMQESVDLFRELTSNAEEMLAYQWDYLRTMLPPPREE